MPTTLKKTNVVIVGLGAAGGVACLPLAQAGIEVIGLDAGPRLNTRDMAPDELRLNRGVWPPGPQKTDGEAPTFRANASATAVQGTFSDPFYGGNANFIGWDLIGYPGARTTVAANLQLMDRKPEPSRKSAYDYGMFSKGEI